VLAVAAALFGYVAWRAGWPGGSRAQAAAGSPLELILFLAIVVVADAYLLWLAWPSLLPIADAPDIVHHLLVIHLIQRTHHLTREAWLEPYLLEMMNYTPGVHVLTATVADALRLDGLRVVHPIAAAAVSLKAGLIFLVTLRALPVSRAAPLQAAAAAVLMFVPSQYVLGSFLRLHFYAQVVSETFAVAMLLGVIHWLRSPSRAALAFIALCGIAVFLVWPVWIGPPAIAIAVALLVSDRPWRTRAADAVVVFAPMCFIAVLHAARHAGAASIIGTSGAVTKPSVETLGGWAFLLLCAAGSALALRRSSSRIVVVFLAATLAQAGALALLDWRVGAASFYMPAKMIYLAVLPGAVLAALAVAELSNAMASRAGVARTAAAIAPLLVAALMVRGHVPVKRQRSPIAEPSLAAGVWARDHVPTACVDYFSRHWLTGYWLHLDVLGNPRLSDRMRAETFDFPDVVWKWIQGRGLPYAIVEDFDAVPRDARVDMIPIRSFPPAAVVRNVRPAVCADRSAPIWRLTPPR